MLAQISNWHVSFGVISILTIISLVSLLLIVPINTPQTRSNLQKLFAILGDKRIIFAVLFVVVSLLLGFTLHFPWIGIVVISILCFFYSSYGATTQIMFLDIAQDKYPASVDLASPLNSIFANIGISLGSVTDSVIAGITSINNSGYFAAIYGLIAFLTVWEANHLYQKSK